MTSLKQIIIEIKRQKDNADYVSPSDETMCFIQGQLSNLTRASNLSKESSELLASRLNDKNFLPGTKIPFYRMCDAKFVPYFDKKKDEMVFCKDIEKVVSHLGIGNFVPED